MDRGYGGADTPPDALPAELRFPEDGEEEEWGVYLRVGRKIINSDNLVDADVFEPGEPLSPHGERRADALTVVITTTTVEDGTVGARRIWLEGEDADLFLEALPVYAPVLDS